MLPKSIPVYGLEEFGCLIEADPDTLHSHPCVVQGFTEQWPAGQIWTDLRQLSEIFGTFPVTAGAPQFSTNTNTQMCQVRTDFGTYLKYVESPSRAEELFAGNWTKGDPAALKKMGLPLYCGNLRLVRHSKEPILSQISPLVPAPLECLNDEIPYYYQCGNHVWLYVSLAGSLTPLHQDNNAVIAYLAQLKGHKEAILYSPADKRHFYKRGTGYLDPINPDDRDFPTWREAQPWKASLGPGELLIWGPNWAHHVITKTDSITVSFDIVNSGNLEDYTGSADWREELGRFARKNAKLIRSRMPDLAIRDALGHATEPDLGRQMMLCVLSASLNQPLSEQSRRVKTRMLRTLETEDGAFEPAASGRRFRSVG